MEDSDAAPGLDNQLDKSQEEEGEEDKGYSQEFGNQEEEGGSSGGGKLGGEEDEEQGGGLATSSPQPDASDGSLSGDARPAPNYSQEGFGEGSEPGTSSHGGQQEEARGSEGDGLASTSEPADAPAGAAVAPAGIALVTVPSGSGSSKPGSTDGSRTSTPRQTILQKISEIPTTTLQPNSSASASSGPLPPLAPSSGAATATPPGVGPTSRLSATSSAASTAAPPPGPSYLHPTAVLPKPPLQEYTNAEQEQVQAVFGPASFQGIRSLPNALNPDFRQRLYEELIETGQLDRQGLLPTTRVFGGMSYSIEVGAHGTSGPPLALGLKPVARVHPYAGTFTKFEYLPSEYDREKVLGKFEKLRGKMSQVGGAPPGGGGAGGRALGD